MEGGHCLEEDFEKESKGEIRIEGEILGNDGRDVRVWLAKRKEKLGVALARKLLRAITTCRSTEPMPRK